MTWSAYPSRAPEFTPGFKWGPCYSIFMCMFCRSLFVLLSFSFWPLFFLSFFRFTDYDYPFGIFKLYLRHLSSCTRFVSGITFTSYYHIYIYIYLEKLPLYNGATITEVAVVASKICLHIIKLYTVHTKNNIYSVMTHNFSLKCLYFR